MMLYVFIFAWTTTICIKADIQLHPINNDDFQNILESVRKDVDRYLQSRSDGKQNVPISETPTVQKEAVIENIENFFEMMRDSMLDNLVKNLGKPADESTVHLSTSSNAPSSDDTVTSTRVPHREEDLEIFLGNVKGEPGVDFPDYTHIPETSFTCSDKPKIPGFYADVDTRCQVFHICWRDRRESFLCPIGTIFNQAYLVCDYWYNSNCSLAAALYTVNSELDPDSSKLENSSLAKKTVSEMNKDHVMFLISKLFPVQAKVLVYSKTGRKDPKIITAASTEKDKVDLKSKHRKKRVASNHSRVTPSMEHADYSIDPQINILKAKIKKFRYFETLNYAVMDIKSDKSLSDIWEYVDVILKKVKYWLFKDETPQMLVNVEPETELYEYDISVQKEAKEEHYTIKFFVECAANFLYQLNNTLNISEDEFQEEPETQSPTPLTQLNPKFIVKPAVEKDESKFSKMRVRRALDTLNPLTSQDVNIYPETKEALLKSYVKLYKRKHS